MHGASPPFFLPPSSLLPLPLLSLPSLFPSQKMVQDAAINVASSSLQQQQQQQSQESNFSGGADAMYAPPTMNAQDARSTSVAADPFTSDPFAGGGAGGQGEQDIGNPFAQ